MPCLYYGKITPLLRKRQKLIKSLKLGVERMVSLGDVLRYGPKPIAKHLKILNDESHALVKRHPDFFVAFCYLNPLLGEKAVRTEMDRCWLMADFERFWW